MRVPLIGQLLSAIGITHGCASTFMPCPSSGSYTKTVGHGAAGAASQSLPKGRS